MGCCCSNAGTLIPSESAAAEIAAAEDIWDQNGTEYKMPDLSPQVFQQLACEFSEVNVSSLVQVEGPVLKMIESGSIALVRGKYLMHLADTGQPIPRRQDAPPSAFWPCDEAAALFRRSQSEIKKPGPDLAGLLFLGLFLVAFSYCWITPTHPDPEGYHLKRIVGILRAMARLRKGYSTYDDVGVFWDYLSLHQNCAHGGAKRSAIESSHFSLALSAMQYIYAHDLACVVKLRRMPACPHQRGADGRFETLIDGESKRLGWEYADRGWPTFESYVANLSRATQWSRLQFSEESLQLDGECPKRTNPPLLLDFRYKHVTNDPPVHPDRLAEQLMSKTFAIGSDHTVVVDLYRRTFDTLCKATTLHFVTFVWPHDMCEAFGEALAAYEELVTLSLVDGSIGDGRVRKPADPQALRSLLRHVPTRTKLHHARYHDMRASTECIEIFVSSLPSCVQHLALPENPLRDPCAHMLARVLPTTTPMLKHLDFKGHYTGQVQFSKGAKQALQAAMPRCNIVY